jgi:hypothetical protein
MCSFPLENKAVQDDAMPWSLNLFSIDHSPTADLGLLKCVKAWSYYLNDKYLRVKASGIEGVHDSGQGKCSVFF